VANQPSLVRELTADGRPVLPTASSLPEPYWQRDGVTLYKGNALEIMTALPSVDMVLSDPPWNYDAYFEHAKDAELVKHDDEMGWFGKAWLWDAAWMTKVDRLHPRAQWYFVGWHHLPAFLRIAALLNWVVQEVWPCDRHEWLIYIGPEHLTASNHTAVRNALALHGNPNRKPAEQLIAMLRVTESSGAGTVVLDPFCGEGSTLEAAARMGCRAIGIEAREENCALAKARLELMSYWNALLNGTEKVQQSVDLQEFQSARAATRPPKGVLDGPGTAAAFVASE